jgi:BirA family biotin operon repressor/biotin-[acetyl-CoA-carboxylase] ligase
MSSSPKKLLILDSVDSTNNYAMALIQKSEIDYEIAVFAKEQTHGKGRRGKQWKSNKGANIIMSVVVQMQWLPVLRQFELSVATALSCYDFFRKYLLENIFIKWPNDIFINDSKAGGILIENVIKGKIWQWSVIGIGLNINEEKFGDDILKATSLKLATQKDYDVIELASELHHSLLKRIEELKVGNFKKMLEEYNNYLYARGKTVKLKKQNVLFETEIISVSSLGELITKDAMERKFVFDEVEFKGLV